MYNANYRHGYFKALLDMSNYIDNHSECLKPYKSKKLDVIHSIIKYLLENADVLDEFMKYGGEMPSFKISERKTKSGGFDVNKV